MPWEVLIWLVAFILQSALLGVSMYQLVQLTDLEADNINPHDAANSYNWMVLPEYFIQLALAALLFLTGNWVPGILPAALLAYNLRQYQRGRHLADVTEIFREVAGRRKATLAKMVLNLLGFVYTIYCFIHVIVVGLITPTGRSAARSILKEAAAALHRSRA